MRTSTKKLQTGWNTESDKKPQWIFSLKIRISFSGPGYLLSLLKVRKEQAVPVACAFCESSASRAVCVSPPRCFWVLAAEPQPGRCSHSSTRLMDGAESPGASRDSGGTKGEGGYKHDRYVRRQQGALLSAACPGPSAGAWAGARDLLIQPDLQLLPSRWDGTGRGLVWLLPVSSHISGFHHGPEEEHLLISQKSDQSSSLKSSFHHSLVTVRLRHLSGGFFNLQTSVHKVRVTACRRDGQASTFERISSERRTHSLRGWTDQLLVISSLPQANPTVHVDIRHFCYRRPKRTGAREQWNDLWARCPPPPSMRTLEIFQSMANIQLCVSISGLGCWSWLEQLIGLPTVCQDQGLNEGKLPVTQPR